MIPGIVTQAESAVERFVTELRCVAARCLHVTFIDPPHSHPACPKCGGPVRLETRLEKVASDVGSNARDVLAELEAMEERVLARVRADLAPRPLDGHSAGQIDLLAREASKTHDPVDLPMNLKAPEPQRDPEMPPGSA